MVGTCFLCFRHPNMACEVLTADVYAIIDKLTNNEVYYTVPCQSELVLVFTED